ncbi:MAG TPA: NAD-dependent succinate-semialdehyde dehydrogenase [Acidimicrobiia bacterium]|nr:NAD-dependent succinate-semialdehyde dehydrogenase [Acidimicrobiia bacterium]
MSRYDVVDRLAADGHDRLLIGGDWGPASDGSVIEVLDPSTGEPITSVPSASAEDARAAVDAAAGALPSWAAASPIDRSEILRRAFELMTERADELARLIVFEMGKTLSEAMGEIRYAAEFFRWYSGEAVRNDGTIKTAPGGAKKIVAIHQPVGVSLLITPWNFPAAMATRKIGPAVAAGCTMILKPASDTPLTALAVGALLEEAGLPTGVLNVVPSSRSSQVVPVMLSDHRVRKLSFTGSTEVGRTLLKGAADQIINCSMELGGNAPFLVFDDADIDAAVDGAMIAKMRNGGQSCIAANRFLVHSAVVDEFGETFSKAMGSVKVGPGLDEGIDLGPMINRAAQRDLREVVESLTGAGARVSVGGSAPDRPGFFFEPTVVQGVGRDDPTLSVEVFGPVAPVVTFESEEEAIVLANDTIHGLAAYLYTADLGRAMRVAEAIETGMVGINRGLISDPAAPFGGVKESGIGREGAHAGLDEFLETKYIAVSW